VVDNYERLPDGVHPQITPEELDQADEAVRRDKKVIELAAEIGAWDAHLALTRFLTKRI
jgi:hypothetical protein